MVIFFQRQFWAMNGSLAGRWLRRYKLFFFLGLLILCVQLILGYLLPIFVQTDDILLKSSNHNNNNHPSANTNQHNNKQSNRIIDDEDNNSIISNTYAKSAKGIYSKEIIIDVNSKKFHLRLDELTFTPDCEILTKEAVSAIHRANTQQCKETIANITCAIQRGTFYPQTLPNFCPNGNYSANRALGCFKDEKKFRILSGYYTNFKTLNTPHKCIQMCLQSGFLYAGVQYS